MNNKVPMRLLFVLVIGAALAFSAGCGSGSAETHAMEAPSIPAVEGSRDINPVPVQEAPVSSLTVRHIAGDAYVSRGGDVLPLSVEDSVFEGDEVITGSDSMVILKQRDGKQIWVAADSLLEITSLTEDGDGETTILTLNDGNVVSVIDEKLGDGDSYDVETPGLVMAIRGTIASVSYDAQAKESAAAFFEGSGIVGSKTKADVMEVSLGERVTVIDGRLERDSVTGDALNESERQFLFDAEYGDPEDREHIDERLEELLATQALADAVQAPPSVESPEPQPEPVRADRAETQPTPQEETPPAPKNSGGDDFFAIKEEFLQAKKDYGRGNISKDEFLRIKQKFINAKAAYNN